MRASRFASWVPTTSESSWRWDCRIPKCYVKWDFRRERGGWISEPQKVIINNFTHTVDPNAWWCDILWQTQRKLIKKMGMQIPYYNGPFMVLNWISLKYCFSVPSGNSSSGYPSVKRTVIILRGKKKSMKSPYFAIRILQQPTALKSNAPSLDEITNGVKTCGWVGELTEKKKTTSTHATTSFHLL